MKSVLAPAKLNLFLRIVRRREDGYHDIETLFQRVGLYDRLTFEHTKGAEDFELVCRGDAAEADALNRIPPEDNLVMRACRLVVEHTGRSLAGLRIVLEKRIPVGGGLGGGSSDAAATLLALNEMLDLHLPPAALCDLAAQLGSDVPSFLGPPTAIGRGRGEILTPVAHASCFCAALAFPDVRVSTAAAYARYDPALSLFPGDLGGLTQALCAGDLERALALMANQMEPLAFALEPRLRRWRQDLEQSAERPVRMSGSGSTLFTLTRTESEAVALCERWHATSGIRAVSAPFLGISC